MKIQLYILLLTIFSFECNGKRNARQVQIGSGCTTPDGFSGECINIKECPELLELLQNSRSAPNSRDFLRKSLCKYEQRNAIVCCRSKQSDTTPTPSSETSTTADNAANNSVYELASPPDCGFTNVSQQGIVDGPAELGTWPWIVAVAYDNTFGGVKRDVWLCGGTLITTKHVLSAAHCYENRNSLVYKVYLGQVDLFKDGNPIILDVEKIVIHPLFDNRKNHNDISIIFLQNDITFSKYIKPICLPTSPELRKLLFVRNFPYVAGWGDTSRYVPGPLEPKELIQVQLPVIGNEECKTAYTGKLEIISSQLCAGFMRGGKGTCRGDSGGPLMLKRKGIDYLIGVVSKGIGCALPSYPDIFSRVTSHLEWIEYIIRSTKVGGVNSKPAGTTVTIDEIATTTASSSIRDTSTESTISNTSTKDNSTVSTIRNTGTKDNSTVSTISNTGTKENSTASNISSRIE